LTLHISNMTQDRAIVTIECQYEFIFALSYGDISSDVDGPLTQFSTSRHIWSQISRKWCVLGTKFLWISNRKPYLIYLLLSCLMNLTGPLNASCGFVSISCAGFFIIVGGWRDNRCYLFSVSVSTFICFLPARRSKHGICYGNVDVTCGYFIKTVTPILKLFRPSGSPIILVSSDLCSDTQFQGESLQRDVKYTWGWKNWRFST